MTVYPNDAMNSKEALQGGFGWFLKTSTAKALVEDS